jgi:hypothetical protein
MQVAVRGAHVSQTLAETARAYPEERSSDGSRTIDLRQFDEIHRHAREGAEPNRLRSSQMPTPADFEYANLPLDRRIACFFGGVLFV